MGVMPAYFPNGTLNRKYPMKPETCAARLRQYCKANGTSTQRPLAYIANPNLDNATVQADQYAAVFLLTRGDYAWIGNDYRGCKSEPYPRPVEWDTDYGEPVDVCAETGSNSMVFERTLLVSKVSVHMLDLTLCSCQRHAHIQ